MTLRDILAKLGIFRMGVKTGTYTTIHDMPTEFLMDDVFDAERDLVTAKDIKQVLGRGEAAKPANAQAAFCTGCGARLEPDAKFCGECGQKV